MPSTTNPAVGIRVRMYRVGFGDFFLMTVPGANGPEHILIDCGVHAANLGSIDECVDDLIKVTNGRIALIIVTHYHADHLSGFSTCYDKFAQLPHVGAVWITNRLDPSDAQASKLMLQLTSASRNLGTALRLRLAAGEDPVSRQALAKIENALGATGDDGDSGGNAKALKLLQSGFQSKPPVYYYQGGDTPTLPPELAGVLTAELLAPGPKDATDGRYKASDDKSAQYLALAAATDLDQPLRPFEKDWPSCADDLPEEAFDSFDSNWQGPGSRRTGDGAARLEATLQSMQPDALSAAADSVDGTLNNQSLVVLFTCKGKKLLFVGDAQWGNWSSWLYERKVSGKDPGITDRAKNILGTLDFYKVGHHGSTNANPIPAVEALAHTCAAMCSTATGAYGNRDKQTEVPRTALMDALEQQTGNRLVRSDWVPALGNPADPEALAELPTLPEGFSTPGELYIDFEL